MTKAIRVSTAARAWRPANVTGQSFGPGRSISESEALEERSPMEAPKRKKDGDAARPQRRAEPGTQGVLASNGSRHAD